jgi:hypothetical protein
LEKHLKSIKLNLRRILMRNDLKLLVSSALVVIAFSAPSATHGMEDNPLPPVAKRKASTEAMQLIKGDCDTILESVLGTGNNVLLKMRVDLECLKGLKMKLVGEPHQQDIPVRLFLTDFSSSVTHHAPVEITVKVDCAPSSATCNLPPKPDAFESYDQFTSWLSQANFTNRIAIAYNFNVDIDKSAPSLAELLVSASPPGGYHFSGTYAIENTAQPTGCDPQVTYSSKRGTVNTTTVTLEGAFDLNGSSYCLEPHSQTFPHPITGEHVFKRDTTQKFYSSKWLAQSEVTKQVTHAEFPAEQRQNWPGAPAGVYSLLRQEPSDLEEIQHENCWHGTTGEEVDISDGRIFSVVCEAINKPVEASEFLVSIIRDYSENPHTKNLYTIRYRYSEVEARKRAETEAKHRAEELAKENARLQLENERQAQEAATRREADQFKELIAQHEKRFSETEEKRLALEQGLQKVAATSADLLARQEQVSLAQIDKIRGKYVENEAKITQLRNGQAAAAPAGVAPAPAAAPVDPVEEKRLNDLKLELRKELTDWMNHFKILYGKDHPRLAEYNQ